MDGECEVWLVRKWPGRRAQKQRLKILSETMDVRIDVDAHTDSRGFIDLNSLPPIHEYRLKIDALIVRTARPRIQSKASPE